jgi:hypothetical protein
MSRKPRGDPSHFQGTAIAVRINQILPCLTCCERRAAERSLEEVVSVFVAALHGELPRQDGRPLRLLPRACCKQPRVKAELSALPMSSAG